MPSLAEVGMPHSNPPPPQLIGRDSGAGQESKRLLLQTQKTMCAQLSTKRQPGGEWREALLPEHKTRKSRQTLEGGRKTKVGAERADRDQTLPGFKANRSVL